MPNLRDLFVYGFVGVCACMYVYLLMLLLKGPLRAYFGLFMYVVILLLTLVLDLSIYKAPAQTRGQVFLIDETIRWGAVYLVVHTFVWKALSAKPQLGWVRHWLILVSVLIVFTALFFTRNPRADIWLYRAISIVSVAGMLLNLILWTLLVRYRNHDITLFLITSGLGIQAALEAAAWSMRSFRALFEPAYYIGLLGHVLCLVVWVTAFRGEAASILARRNQGVTE